MYIGRYLSTLIVILPFLPLITSIAFIVSYLNIKSKMEKKIRILSLIKEEKEKLFGRFSATLSHEQKVLAWKEVTEKAKSLGLYNKDWKYLRDTTWQNWRKRTLEKRDYRKRTGSGGGPSCVYDDGDKIIFEIIGWDSPNLNGLPIPKSSGSDSVLISNPLPEESIENIPPSQKPKAGPKRIKDNNDLITLKKQRLIKQNALLDLQAVYKKKEIRKIDLEIHYLEKELGLSNSATSMEHQDQERVGGEILNINILAEHNYNQ